MSGFSRSCRKNRELLPEYAEGALNEPAHGQVERHLAGCRRCRTDLRDITLVIRGLRSLHADPVPEHVVPRVQRAVHDALAPPPIARRLWTRAAVPAVLALVLVAAAFALRSTGPTRLADSALNRAPALSVADRGPLPAAPPGDTPAAVEDALVIAAKPATAAPQESGSFEWQAPMAGSSGAPEPRASAPEAPSQAKSTQGPPALAGPRREESRDSSLAEARPRTDAAGTYARGGASPPHPKGRAGVGLRWYSHRAPESERESAPTSAAEMTAREGAGEPAASSPPVSARATAMRHEGRPAIGIRLAARQGAGDLRVSIGPPDASRLIWQGPHTDSGPIIITTDLVGAGPAAIPITIDSQQGPSHYMLFLPTMARLGDTSSAAPTAHYDGQPLRQVLADFSAFTGYVILAQAPLDRPVVGPLPQGPPESSLAELAASVDLQVEREDAIVRTLTHHR